MSYSINISGHDDSPDISQAEKDEHAVEFTKRFVARDLRGVGYATVNTATFGTTVIRPEPQPAPAPEPAPTAAAASSTPETATSPDDAPSPAATTADTTPTGDGSATETRE